MHHSLGKLIRISQQTAYLGKMVADHQSTESFKLSKFKKNARDKQILVISVLQQITQQYQITMSSSLSSICNLQTSNSISLDYSYIGQYPIPFYLQSSILNSTVWDSNCFVSNRINSENQRTSLFKSHSIDNIILKEENPKKKSLLKYSKNPDSQSETKLPIRKCGQKETRNISSNLLRIFLKNLIELRSYDSLLEKISIKFGIKKQFYQWIQSFNINFKNYISVNHLKKIMKTHQPFHYRKILIIMLHHYSQNTGITHCLTSKRIERKSTKMHLQGLRRLCQELLEGSQNLKNHSGN